MGVRDKTPEKILVNTELLKTTTMENDVLKETQKEVDNSKNVFLALLGGLTSSLLTLFPSWSNWSTLLRVIVVSISIVYLLLTIWFAAKYLQSKRRLSNQVQDQNIESTIVEQSKGKIRYTALLIICFQKVKTGEVKFMTEKPGNYLIHCEMIPQNDVQGQKDGIINYLMQTYNVQKNDIKEILPLSAEPFFSIKPIHGEEVQNGFIFFQIRLKKRSKQQLVNHRDAEWKTIQEMEAMPELMGRNQDIVMALNDNKTKISDSFEDFYGPIHIIWNITKKCSYNCAICATKDDSRSELSTEEKLRVLNNIFSAKEKISTLDFAGGDPMLDRGIRTVIMQAVNSMGEDHVSVTTTGNGIQATAMASEEETAKLLKKCEITIDASHENLANDGRKSTFSRKSPKYNSSNYNQIENMSENIQNLVINIPLIDDDLDDVEIGNLKNKLYQLKRNYSNIQMEAQIIRLMPVGAFTESYDASEYAKYRPINTAKRIMQSIKETGISCRYHCSLRILPEIDECDLHCNMLERKIGIDCFGNVFACTWGAYLHMPNGQDIKHNPFYLGNLTSTSLRNILEGQEGKTSAYKRITRDVSNQTNKPYCEAVSWFFNKDISKNHDPLSTN